VAPDEEPGLLALVPAEQDAPGRRVDDERGRRQVQRPRPVPGVGVPGQRPDPLDVLGVARVAGEKILHGHAGNRTGRLPTPEKSDLTGLSLREAITRIQDIIRQIHDTRNTIAIAVEEQLATTNEINRSVSEVSTGSGEIARAFTSVADATGGTATGAGLVRTAAESLVRTTAEGLDRTAAESLVRTVAEGLDRIAAELQQLVDRFRY
jgi:hypothetical protein